MLIATTYQLTEIMATEANQLILEGILDSLEDIGHSDDLLEEGILESAIEQGLSSQAYVELVTSLAWELKSHYGLQETVSIAVGLEDEESFQLELRSFLNELHCPHSSLISGGMQVLGSYKKRILVVDFLLSEVLAARLATGHHDNQEPMEINGGQEEVHGVAGNLAAILKVYNFNKPAPTVTVRQIYERIIGKTRELLSNAPSNYIDASLIGQSMEPDHWVTLDRINETLTEEYRVRRQMLLTRCDVTVQSFRWSNKMKGKEDEFSKVYDSRRQSLKLSSPVNIARVMCAKPDLLAIERTNDSSVRGGTQCLINRVLIGKVPDRGGRPRETRPNMEMPAFRKRTAAPQDQRGSGHGKKGKGRGGGRVQGGWAGGRGNKGGGGWSQHGH